MYNTVKIEDHFTDIKRIYIPREGDNLFVGLLANALRLAARDGYRLTSTLEDQHGEIVLTFERGKHDQPAPVMRKAR